MREIEEETTIASHLLSLKKEGDPFETEGGGRSWRIWSFLWEVKLSSAEGRVEDKVERSMEGLVRLNGEHVEAKWVTLEEMEGMRMVPGLRNRFRELLGKEERSS